MSEIWKDVIGYEGLYQISDNGKLRSTERTIKYPDGYSDRLFKSKELSLNVSKNGYIYFDLYRNQKRKRFFSHVLVMMSFIRPKQGFEDINHINGIKKDNRIDNLEYCSRSENMIHAFKIGLCEKTRNSARLKINKK